MNTPSVILWGHLYFCLSSLSILSKRFSYQNVHVMTRAPITSSGLFSVRVQLTLGTLKWQWDIWLQYFIERKQ